MRIDRPKAIEFVSIVESFRVLKLKLGSLGVQFTKVNWVELLILLFIPLILLLQ